MSTENDYTNFYEWIRMNGGQIHEHVKIDSKEQRGLFTTDTIEQFAALAIVPRSIIVNQQHPDLLAIETDAERYALMSFLLREHNKREKSFWFPWIKLLNIDKETDELLKKQMHIFECVEYSTLGQALTARYQQLQEEYEQRAQWSEIIDADFELFCAVDHLIWSRALDLPENEPLSLVPFIDFANHSLNPNARWFIDDKTHNLILRSERTLSSHEEITISYGSKSNEELLYLYGFTLSDNPNDRVTIPVSLSPDDFLLEEKIRLLRKLKLPPRLTFNIDGHLNNESQQLATILSAQTQTTLDQEHEYFKPYLTQLLNEYHDKLNTCSCDEQFIGLYLRSQDSIVKNAMEVLK